MKNNQKKILKSVTSFNTREGENSYNTRPKCYNHYGCNRKAKTKKIIDDIKNEQNCLN